MFHVILFIRIRVRTMNNIMNDNLLYLEAWMNYNPKLRENLTMDGTNLICKINGNLESINIKNFYLPEMLYNEEFRIQVANELEAEDLFEIIKIYVQTKEILEKEQEELKKSPTITEITLRKDKENKEFIVLIDEENKRYRYDTTKPEQIINYYNELKEKKGIVSLKELGSVIQNGI